MQNKRLMELIAEEIAGAAALNLSAIVTRATDKFEAERTETADAAEFLVRHCGYDKKELGLMLPWAIRAAAAEDFKAFNSKRGPVAKAAKSLFLDSGAEVDVLESMSCEEILAVKRALGAALMGFNWPRRRYTPLGWRLFGAEPVDECGCKIEPPKGMVESALKAAQNSEDLYRVCNPCRVGFLRDDVPLLRFEFGQGYIGVPYNSTRFGDAEFLERLYQDREKTADCAQYLWRMSQDYSVRDMLRKNQLSADLVRSMARNLQAIHGKCADSAEWIVNNLVTVGAMSGWLRLISRKEIIDQADRCKGAVVGNTGHGEGAAVVRELRAAIALLESIRFITSSKAQKKDRAVVAMGAAIQLLVEKGIAE